MKQEKIVCIPRAALEAAINLGAHIIKLDEAKARDLFNTLPFVYEERALAETDSSLKQLIPYCVLRNEAGDFFVYERKGSEQRLHGLCSLGIGGHLNTDDEGQDLFSIIANGAVRELLEEMPSLATALPPEARDARADPAPSTGAVHGLFQRLTLRGIINEEESSVGSVHTGLVFELSVEAAAIKDVDAELRAWRWEPEQDLDLPRFETWSQLAYELLHRP